MPRCTLLGPYPHASFAPLLHELPPPPLSPGYVADCVAAGLAGDVERLALEAGLARDKAISVGGRAMGVQV